MNIETLESIDIPLQQSQKVRKSFLFSDFSKGKHSYEAWTAMWGKENIIVFVDIPDGDTINQWVGAVNNKLLWIDENKDEITQAVIDSDIFSNIHEWSSEAVTSEDFRAGLYISELGFSFQWKQTQVYIQCDRDYFLGHCICLYLDEENRITGCGLEG